MNERTRWDNPRTADWIWRLISLRNLSLAQRWVIRIEMFALTGLAALAGYLAAVVQLTRG